MGDLAGVGIEPDEQTELIDATELLPGLLLTRLLTRLLTHSLTYLLTHAYSLTLTHSLHPYFIPSSLVY